MKGFSRCVAAAMVLATGVAAQSGQFVVNSSPPGYYDANTISGCSFWATVQSGNTCNLLEQYFNITASQFQIYNPAVNSNCTNLLVGYSYCIQVNNGTGPTPTTNSAALPPGATGDNNVAPSPVQSGFPSTCNNYYYVSENSTCGGIVDFYGGAITQAQLVSWNPAINNCSNLLVNYFLCTGLSTTNTTATPSSGPTSTASSTNSTGTSSGGTISTSVSKSSSSTGGPQPEQTGIASNCNAYYLVKSGDTCQGIVNQYGNFTLSQFYSWNPAVGNSCGGLQAGYYVCVGTTASASSTSSSVSSTRSSVSSTSSTSSTSSGAPSPHQTGIASNCTMYYQAVSGDSCSSIAAQNGTFTVAQFEGWNPAVGTNCTSLWVGDWYCVAVPGTPTKAAPSPHQSGIASNCKQYYQAKSGDTCSSIAAVNNTYTVTQFENWNPAVGSKCSSLLVGDWYCTGV